MSTLIMFAFTLLGMTYPVVTWPAGEDTACIRAIHKPFVLKADWRMVRFAHLQAQSPLGSKTLGLSSELFSADGRSLSWHFSSGVVEADLAFGLGSMRGLYQSALSPQRLATVLQENGVTAKRQGILEFVYKNYLEQTRRRRMVFTPEFIEQLRAEDVARKEDALAIWAIYDPFGPAMAWAVYDYGDGQITIGRVAKRRDFNGVELESILPYISEYLRARQVASGMFLIQSDLSGSALYQRFGFQPLDEYEPGKFNLRSSVADFIARYPPPTISNGSRPVRVRLFMGEAYFE